MGEIGPFELLNLTPTTIHVTENLLSLRRGECLSIAMTNWREINARPKEREAAALIVKAVNAHEAMKKALANAVSLIDEDIIRVRPSDRKQLLAALAEWNAALSLAEGVE